MQAGNSIVSPYVSSQRRVGLANQNGIVGRYASSQRRHWYGRSMSRAFLFVNPQRNPCSRCFRKNTLHPITAAGRATLLAVGDIAEDVEGSAITRNGGCVEIRPIRILLWSPQKPSILLCSVKCVRATEGVATVLGPGVRQSMTSDDIAVDITGGWGEYTLD